MASPRFVTGVDYATWDLRRLEERAAGFEALNQTSGPVGFKRALSAARAKVEARAKRVQRHPLAFGITTWGPLPGTRDAYLMWEPSGGGLTFYARDPSASQSPGMPVRGALAELAKTATTVQQADRIVRRWIGAGIDEADREDAAAESEGPE
jgi:hypothetical protein